MYVKRQMNNNVFILDAKADSLEIHTIKYKKWFLTDLNLNLEMNTCNNYATADLHQPVPTVDRTKPSSESAKSLNSEQHLISRMTETEREAYSNYQKRLNDSF
jgi:hypothetical protein